MPLKLHRNTFVRESKSECKLLTAAQYSTKYKTDNRNAAVKETGGQITRTTNTSSLQNLYKPLGQLTRTYN